MTRRVAGLSPVPLMQIKEASTSAIPGLRSRSESSKGDASMWRVISSVLAAFFGVQKESRRQEDFSQGGAGRFILAGVLLAIVLVLLIAGVAFLASR